MGGHESSEEPARLGDDDLLSVLDPRGHSGESDLKVSDRCCRHRETKNVSQRVCRQRGHPCGDRRRIGRGVDDPTLFRGELPGAGGGGRIGLFPFRLVCGVGGDTFLASMATIAVLGTFDTKGEEHRYVADRIREHGHAVLLIDVGTLGPTTLEAQVSREEVAREAGVDMAAVVARRDRGEAVALMTRAAPLVLSLIHI